MKDVDTGMCMAMHDYCRKNEINGYQAIVSSIAFIAYTLLNMEISEEARERGVQFAKDGLDRAMKTTAQ